MNKDVRHGRRAALTAVAAIVIAASLPAAASAGTGSVAGGVLTYTGDAAVDDISITLAQGAYVVGAVSGPAPVAGPGCQASGERIRCAASTVTSLVVNLGDGDDKVSNLTFAPATIDAGPGTDRVVSGFAADQVTGGEGNDSLNGSWGNDVFVADGGGDTVWGDLGTDTLDYSARTAPLAVTVGAGADDGASGEGDNVSEIDVLLGGSGGDALSGGSGSERIDGGPGADTLAGADGDDTLAGGSGADSFDGGAGADAVLAADGEADTGTCGAELDTFEADGADVLDATCEGWTPGVTVGSGGKPDVEDVVDPGVGDGVGAGTGDGASGTVFELPIGVVFGAKPTPFYVARGTVSLALTCAEDAAGGCTGTVTLTIGPRPTGLGTARRRSTRGRKTTAIGRRRFKLAAGKEAAVSVRLSRRGRRVLSKRRRTKVHATVTMNTPAGKRYETRTIVVERRVVRKARKPVRRGRGRRR